MRLMLCQFIHCAKKIVRHFFSHIFLQTQYFLQKIGHNFAHKYLTRFLLIVRIHERIETQTDFLSKKYLFALRSMRLG